MFSAHLFGLSVTDGGEQTLLNILMGKIGKGKKFSKMDVKRVYFGYVAP